MTILKFPTNTRPAQQIEARIAALKRHAANMREVNMLLAAGDLDGVAALGFNEAQIAALKQPNSLGEIGFSSRTFADIEKKIGELVEIRQ